MTKAIQFLDLFENRQEQFLVRCGVPQEIAEKCVEAGGKKWSLLCACWVCGFQGTKTDGFPDFTVSLLFDGWENEELRSRKWSIIKTKLKSFGKFKEGVLDNPQRPILPPMWTKDPASLNISDVNHISRTMQVIRDWKQGASRGLMGLPPEQINLQQWGWIEALDRAEAWHKKIEALQKERGLPTKDGEEVVLVFEDNSYWLDLKKSTCSDEAKAMGHCGNGSYNLYSLRQAATRGDVGKLGLPKVTADIDVGDGVAHQISIAGNKKPGPEYHERILALFAELGVREQAGDLYGGYFELEDLDSQMREDWEAQYGELSCKSNEPIYTRFDPEDGGVATERWSEFQRACSFDISGEWWVGETDPESDGQNEYIEEYARHNIVVGMDLTAPMDSTRRKEFVKELSDVFTFPHYDDHQLDISDDSLKFILEDESPFAGETTLEDFIDDLIEEVEKLMDPKKLRLLARLIERHGGKLSEEYLEARPAGAWEVVKTPGQKPFRFFADDADMAHAHARQLKHNYPNLDLETLEFVGPCRENADLDQVGG